MPSPSPMARCESEAERAIVETCDRVSVVLVGERRERTYWMGPIAGLDLGRPEERRGTRLLVDVGQVPDLQQR